MNLMPVLEALKYVGRKDAPRNVPAKVVQDPGKPTWEEMDLGHRVHARKDLSRKSRPVNAQPMMHGFEGPDDCMFLPSWRVAGRQWAHPPADRQALVAWFYWRRGINQ